MMTRFHYLLVHRTREYAPRHLDDILEVQYSIIFTLFLSCMLTRHLCDQEDWKRDSGEEPALSYGAFCDALFELADIWVESTRVDHYAVFLGILRSHVEDPSSWGKDWSAFASERTPRFERAVSSWRLECSSPNR